jgi:ribonuclease P protein component
MQATETLSKAERISSRTQIDTLFGGGSRSMSAFPVRMVYRQVERQEGEPPAQILISVPKRCFKRAVKRNRVKRQIREAYRHNKLLLNDYFDNMPGKGLDIAFIWMHNELTDTATVNSRIVSLLKRITEKRNAQ